MVGNQPIYEQVFKPFNQTLFSGDSMDLYKTVAEHILDAIGRGNFTIGGIVETTRECYGDSVEMVNLVLGMMVERGILTVMPTGVDRDIEPLPVAWWSVSLA